MAEDQDRSAAVGREGVGPYPRSNGFIPFWAALDLVQKHYPGTDREVAIGLLIEAGRLGPEVVRVRATEGQTRWKGRDPPQADWRKLRDNPVLRKRAYWHEGDLERFLIGRKAAEGTGKPAGGTGRSGDEVRAAPRARGSGRISEKLRPFAEEGLRLVESGEAPSDRKAALMLVDKAKAAGAAREKTEAANVQDRIDRAIKAYRKSRNIG